MSRGPSGGAVLSEGFLRHLLALSPFAVASHAEKQQPAGFCFSSEATVQSSAVPADERFVSDVLNGESLVARFRPLKARRS